MCGITGFFNNPKAVENSLKSLDSLKERGRDGYGFFDGKKLVTTERLEELQNKENSNNCLAHCLHSVVGFVKQPIKNKGVLAANCEIYNWKELNKKHGLNARNDAELLLKMLEKNKNVKQALSELNGVFAIAFWDKERVVLARDMLGEKPLWYSLEKGLAFASEKKALAQLDLQNVVELNPRKILVYAIEKNKAQFLGQKFFSLEKETRKPFAEIKKELEEKLVDSIRARVPEKKFGILFSGGVDSTLLAIICKNLGLDFSCYIGVVEGKNRKPPEDLLFAEKIAKELGLELKTKKISLEQAGRYLERIVPLVEDSNVIKAGVALPLFLACEKAKEDGVKVVFSGMGADELFAGYARFERHAYINKECLSGLRRMFERDLYRDDVICMANNIELRLPFLDKKIIDFALKIPEEFKINGGRKKIVLKEISKDLGLRQELAERKKTAAQYGSNSDWAIEKLAKQNGFETKSAFLKKFYSKPNVVLGALVSGGKDSVLAMEIMKKQNYEVACLITMKSKNKHSLMFHTPAIDVVKLQAKAMAIPLVMKGTSGKKEKELDDLKKAIKNAMKKFGIEGIVCGALYSNYQRERIENIADDLGLKVFAPLWHKNQEQEIKEMLQKKYRVIFSAVAAQGLSKELLGKEIDEKNLERLKTLNRENGLNIAGEGGEYESLVLDSPLFKKRIKLLETQIQETGQGAAQLVVKKAELEQK